MSEFVLRQIADSIFKIPVDIKDDFDSLWELMMICEEGAFYDLALEFDEKFGEYECQK